MINKLLSIFRKRRNRYSRDLIPFYIDGCVRPVRVTFGPTTYDFYIEYAGYDKSNINITISSTNILLRHFSNTLSWHKANTNMFSWEWCPGEDCVELSEYTTFDFISRDSIIEFDPRLITLSTDTVSAKFHSGLLMLSVKYKLHDTNNTTNYPQRISIIDA